MFTFSKPKPVKPKPTCHVLQLADDADYIANHYQNCGWCIETVCRVTFCYSKMDKAEECYELSRRYRKRAVELRQAAKKKESR